MPIRTRRLIFEAPMPLFWQFRLPGDFPVQLACSLSDGLGSGLYLAFLGRNRACNRSKISLLFLISLPLDVNSPLLRYISPCTCALAKAYRLSVYMLAFLPSAFLRACVRAISLARWAEVSRGSALAQTTSVPSTIAAPAFRCPSSKIAASICEPGHLRIHQGLADR